MRIRIKDKVVLLLLLLASSNLYSQTNLLREQNLSAQNASWTMVLNGNAICKPKETSYGFAILTDGKTISTCTDTGLTLWEKKLQGRPESFFTVFSSDFLLTVSDKKNLSLINPSGLTLWTAKLPFDINSEPQIGRDSRIFVKGKNGIACFGVNGIRKWLIKQNDLKSDDMFEFEDGSLLVLKDTLQEQKTTAIRISPFGKVLEEITFSGIVQNACKTQKGILVSFAQGGFGLCSIQNERTVTKWLVPFSEKALLNTISSKGSYIYEVNQTGLYFVQKDSSNTRVLIFNLSDGKVFDFYDVPVSFLDITHISTQENRFFISDKSKALIYDFIGNLIYKANFPQKKDMLSKINYITYTKDNYLILSSKAWMIAGFRTEQKLKGKNKNLNQNKKDYSDYYSIDTSSFESLDYAEKIGSSLTGVDRIETLKKGDYREKEIEYNSTLQSALRAYLSCLSKNYSGGRLESKSIFFRDFTGVEGLLSQVNLSGTDDYPKLIASLIKSEQNSSHLTTILNAVSLCGFDPNGTIISAIDERLYALPADREELNHALCDAVYELCRFMGRPALYSRGMEILTRFFNSRYSNTTKAYARTTLSKIKSIEL